MISDYKKFSSRHRPVKIKRMQRLAAFGKRLCCSKVFIVTIIEIIFIYMKIIAFSASDFLYHLAWLAVFMLLFVHIKDNISSVMQIRLLKVALVIENPVFH